MNNAAFDNIVKRFETQDHLHHTAKNIQLLQKKSPFFAKSPEILMNKTVYYATKNHSFLQIRVGCFILESSV